MKKSQLILRLVIFLPIGGILAILVGFVGLYLYLAPSLPAIDELRNIQLQVPLRIYSKDQKLIAEFGEKRRTPIRYEDVPPLFIDAIKAAEDDNFEAHIGIDIKGLTRAAVQLALTGEKRSGGSTITMQVARNYFLTPEKTFKRKFIEIMLALHIDDTLSKTEIMELYINKIFLGKRAYGIEAAANIYYGKSINELTLPQLAMIAGIPKAPTAYNPINNPERAIQRRNYVLSRMYELDKIDQATYEAAVLAPITAKVYKVQAELEANYVAEWVRSEMLERFPENAYTHGYQVITSIDSFKQQKAQQALQAGLLNFDQQHGLRHAWTSLDTRFIENTEQPDLRFWLDQLKHQPSVGPLIPAVVTEVAEQDFTVLLKSGKFAQVTDFQWARAFKTINALGPKIKQADEVVSVGHQVWVTSSIKSVSTETADEVIEWRLAQPPSIQGALISMDPNTGALQSLIGGFDFTDSKFNRATQSDRQPGSSFKPFIYSAALNAGLTPATLINDAPVVFEDANLEGTWRPKNNSGKFYGPTRLRKALYKSRNLVTIRIMQRIGVRKVAEFLTRFGFLDAKINKNLSLALGASAFTPLEMATAYAILANGGYQIKPYLIEKILDHDGQILYKRPPTEFCDPCYVPELAVDASNQNLDQPSKADENALVQAAITSDDNADAQSGDPVGEAIIAPRVMDARVNYLIYTMMQDVIQRGTGRRARALNRTDLAGKTGTTNDQRDLWFSGFTPDLVTTVWVGFDNYEPLGQRSYGSNVPLPIWIDYMRDVLETVPKRTLPRPEGLVNVRIDPISGLKALPEQNDAIFELFREENVPEEFATLRHNKPSDSGTGELAKESDAILPEQLF